MMNLSIRRVLLAAVLLWDLIPIFLDDHYMLLARARDPLPQQGPFPSLKGLMFGSAHFCSLPVSADRIYAVHKVQAPATQQVSLRGSKTSEARHTRTFARMPESTHPRLGSARRS